MRLLKVQGKGNVRAEPDLITLSFNVESKAWDYEESVRNINMRADDLRGSMATAGLDKAQLKTTAFNVQVDTRYDNGQNIFNGYVASHRMQIELPMDKVLLNKVFRLVAQGHSGAEIQLSFSVKDKDALRKKVLTQAVQTAKENAATLAEAAGVKLGDLVQMDYGWTEVHISERQANLVAMQSSPKAQYDVDIEPQDVLAEDHVTLTFEIVE